MFVIALISIFLALATLLLGTSVIIRNRKDPVNRVFFAICIIASIWTVAFEWTYYIYFSPASVTSPTVFRILNGGSLLLALLIMYSTVLFTYYFPLKRSKKIINIFTPLVAIVAVLSVTDQIAGKVAVVQGKYTNPPGPLIWLYLLTMGLGVMIIIYNSALHQRSLSHLQRAQNKLLAIALISSLLAGAMVGVVVPIIFPHLKLDSLSPFALLLFLAPIANAIRSYRLFDFRAVLVRSLVYVLVVSVLSVVFIAVGILVSTVFTNSLDNLKPGTLITFFTISILLAVSFAPLKRFFDKATNRLFYRDAYNSQELLNELNKSLVTTIDLEDLLNKGASIIGDTLKSEYCTFAIRGSKDPSLRIVGGVQNRLEVSAIQHAVLATAHNPRKTVILDELESDKHYLKELMQSANVSIIVKLQSTNRGHSQHPGYMLLGQKRSGGLYSSQDITVLEIIADELVIAIQNSLRFEEIQQFNITLEQKIDAATKELRRTNAKLKALDEAKDEFISMASHQLRTPLTAVKGYLSMVLDGDTGPVKKNQKELTQNAFDGAQRMVYLIADLLNVSRMQTGKFVIENQPSYLPEVVEAEIAQLKEQIANREITVTYNKPERFPTLNLDETKIRQVIMNFLDNALYYTPKGGKVDIALQATDDSVTYTVTDNGVGVPKAIQHHLFSKFYRADNARKMRPDGTGLGLYMAKKVVIAQGGAIIFKSEEGKGSTFGFSFPRRGLELKGEKAAPKPLENPPK